MFNFDICSYNMGTNQQDYAQKCTYYDSQNKNYDMVQQETSSALVGKAAVYCLQEVRNTQRPLIKALQAQGFEIFRAPNSNPNFQFSAAILLDSKIFKDFDNQSFDEMVCLEEINGFARAYKKDGAIVSATHIASGQRITFVSAHVPGFDFDKPVTELEGKKGDLYCHLIADKLAEIANKSMQKTFHVIGADMNANPEKWQPRFDIFSREGFAIHRTNAPTNVNPADQTNREREIDFVFTNEFYVIPTIYAIWEKFKSFFIETSYYEFLIKENSVLGLAAENNASDHGALFVAANFTTKPNIYQLANSICSLVLSFFYKII